MSDLEKPYLSYLLRLWLVKNQTHCSWRCSLENVQTGERHGFANLDALCVFLSEKIAPLPEGDGANDVVE
jgi:hypothetical protein